MKRVFFDNDAYKRVLDGAEIVYKGAKTTMGIRGRNAVISKPYGSPIVTHDGVTVVKAISLPNVDDQTLGYNAGAEILKEAATKMNDTAGDGTTTVTVLAYHILKEAEKLIKKGYNPMVLRRELEAAAEEVISKLNDVATPVTDSNLYEVANISAGEKEVGDLVTEVLRKVGKDGVVTVEDAQGLETTYDVTEGYTFDNGALSPFMLPRDGKPETILENPAILLTDQKIVDLAVFKGILTQLIQEHKKDILFIANNLEVEALTLLRINNQSGNFNAVAVRAPGHGNKRIEYLDDLADLTGGTMLKPERGIDLDQATIEHLGSAKKVIVTADKTTIIGGGGNVKPAIKRIKQQEKNAKTAYDKSELARRRSLLTGSVAVIRVGGASDTEVEEKKYRVDDAVAAVRCAMAEGIVPGGGTTLLRIAKDMRKDTKGARLLSNALEQPFKIILDNAGVKPRKLRRHVLKTPMGFGVDVKNPDKLVDLMAAGVVDPVMVTKKAVQYAVSVAGTCITMGTLITDIPVDKP